MLKELKAWVARLEEVINELAETYGKEISDIETEWEQFWYDGGYGYDRDGLDLEAIDAFKEAYESQMADEQ